MVDVNDNDPQQHRKQKRHKENKTIAGHTLFVTQRAQALDSAGGEIVHELGIGGGRPAEMIANAAEQRRQIVFAHSEVIVMFRGRNLTTRLETVLVHFFENGFLRRWSCRLWCFGSGRTRRFGSALDGVAVRDCG